MKRVGYLTVTGSGETDILFPWKLKSVEIEFVDEAPVPCLPSCEIHHHDQVKIQPHYFSDVRQYGITIKWHVNAPRKVKWTVRRGFIKCLI